MEKKDLLEAIKKAKEISPKRNFKQSIDLIINVKGLNLKNPEQQVNLFVPLHFSVGKKVKICALVGPEMLAKAKEACDEAISIDDFIKFKEKKQIKKLANSFDYFIAQANIMPQIATKFGRVFGPKGKMPNPKAGCVFPPNANLKPLVEKLQKTVRVQTKNDPIIQCSIGKEDMNEDELIDNGMTIYSTLIRSLPGEKDNIKNIFLKLTMGKTVMIGEKVEAK